MSGPSTDRDASLAASAKRGIRWDAAAAIIASLVGLLALVVAGYTAHIQRQQVSAQVWPYLMMASSDMSSEYMWLNKGVGPAQVESVEVFVNGKSQHDWRAVMATLRLEKPGYGQSTLNGNVVSAGEKVDWLQFGNRDDFQAFRTAARQAKFGVKLCYCSTLGDCWVNDSTKADWNDRHAVGKCPVVPEPSPFHD
jgi:hypothetical protein